MPSQQAQANTVTTNKAINKIRSPNLLLHIIEEIQKDGLVAQEAGILTLLVKIALRNVKNAEPTSSNLFITDKTGKGKDVLTKNVCKVILEKNNTCFHRTSLSPKIFNYWQPRINKKEVSWDTRVVYLEDPPRDTFEQQAFKVMASGNNSVTVLKDQKVLDKTIDGKPVMLVTSMKAQTDIESVRRWSNLQLELYDTKLKITVNKRVNQIAMGTVPYTPDLTFRQLLQSLRPYEVIIDNSLPNIFFETDTTQYKKLLDYIKASAIIHQVQRQVDKEGRLIANVFDMYYGLYIWNHLGDYESSSMNAQEKKIIEVLLEVENIKGMKRTDLETATHLTRHTLLNHYKDNMVEKELIVSFMKFDSSANREVENWKLGKNGVKGSLYKHIQAMKKAYPKEATEFNQIIRSLNIDRKKYNLPNLEVLF